MKTAILLIAGAAAAVVSAGGAPPPPPPPPKTTAAPPPDVWAGWTTTTTTTEVYDPDWKTWTTTTTKCDDDDDYDPDHKKPVPTSTKCDDDDDDDDDDDKAWPTWTAAPAATTPCDEPEPCPAWTMGSEPPHYLTSLPKEIQGALPPWTGAPPHDWCYHTGWMISYTTVECTTTAAPVAPVAPAPAYTTPCTTGYVAPAAAPTYGVAPAKWTGAANSNAASFAVAGLAAAAALVMA